MSADDLRRTASQHYGYASGALSAGRADARRAADFYRMAANQRKWAAFLTSHPETHDLYANPVLAESAARQLVRTADVMLGASFRAEATCAFYTGLGDRYMKLARDHETRGELVLF